MTAISYKTDCSAVNWQQLNDILLEDNFHNGRTVEQHRLSFENSYAVVFAYDEDRIVGTARALSDGVCNAYVVDVWTYSPFRKHGIATTMMSMLAEKLDGQHIYLQADEASGFYLKIGYTHRPIGLQKIVGRWLQNETRDL